MKLTVKKTVEVEVERLIVSANVRYWEDATIDGKEDKDGALVPCRVGENWCPIIDLKTGVIINWKQGVVADIHYKICDAGVYELADPDGAIVSKIDGYVPDMLCPEENGYGDYIIMHVDENGCISGFKPDTSTWLDMADE